MRRLLTGRNVLTAVIAVFAVLSLFFLLLNFRPYLQTARQTLFGLKSGIKNDAGRTNFLILGISGEGHEGPLLTDAIIVASAVTQFPSQAVTVPKVTLISIPRDIYLSELEDKINTAYEKGGLASASAAVTLVTGLPIHYGVSFDFVVLEKVVDLLGGIEVNIPAAFDDYEYPLPGRETDTCGGDRGLLCRYEHLHFDKGPQKLDGKTALKLARSRKAVGEEGTDFARSRRQQLILLAIKEKLFQSSTFLNPATLFTLYSQIKEHMNTDFTVPRLGVLLPLVQKYRHALLSNIVLDLSLLDNPPEDERGWILLPKDGTFAAIHQYIKEQLN